MSKSIYFVIGGLTGAVILGYLWNKQRKAKALISPASGSNTTTSTAPVNTQTQPAANVAVAAGDPVLKWSSSELGNPYIDNTTYIAVNGTRLVEEFGTNHGTLPVKDGDIVNVQCFPVDPNGIASGEVMGIQVTKDGFPFVSKESSGPVTPWVASAEVSFAVENGHTYAVRSYVGIGDTTSA